MHQSDKFFSDQPEKEFSTGRTRSEQKRLGQIFTPYEIARPMAQWISGSPRCEKVLDPAIGLGIFPRALLEILPDRQVEFTGYEIDAATANAASTLFNNLGYTNVMIRDQNFLLSNWDDKYDGILCNPPYLKFRGRSGNKELCQSIEEHTGISIRPSSNLYIFFLIKLIWHLAENGRAAVILPFEFLNADYGRVVKKMLLDRKILRKIVVLGSNLQPFDDVITTACILCLENSPQTRQPFMVTAHSLDELSVEMTRQKLPIGVKQTPIQASEIPISAQKWVAPAIFLKHTPANWVPLSTFGRVMRGIATGDNRFFVLSEEDRLKFNFNMNLVLPCLAKASFAPENVFDRKAFEELRNLGKPVWLVNMAGNEHTESVQRYLEVGIARGSDLRYLTRTRQPWYALENRPPAPLLVTTFSRGRLRWIRNAAGVRNLTAFHGFYPYAATDLDLLNAYLITPLAQQILSGQRREYGNGLYKFEPNDLNRAMILDIRTIPQKIQDQVKDTYPIVLNRMTDPEQSITALSHLFGECL
jgi:adenine-specific DNA-methyltransferase